MNASYQDIFLGSGFRGLNGSDRVLGKLGAFHNIVDGLDGFDGDSTVIGMGEELGIDDRRIGRVVGLEFDGPFGLGV